MKDLKTATQRAHEQFQRALPHIEAARATLAEALGIDPDDRPEADPKKPEDLWEAVCLFQNIWDAHMHVTDPFDS